MKSWTVCKTKAVFFCGTWHIFVILHLRDALNREKRLSAGCLCHVRYRWEKMSSCSLWKREMAIFSSCFLAEHSGRPTSRLPTAFCLAPHGPVIITRPTRLATFPFMPCVAHFRPPLLCPRGYLWRQSCDWSSIWSTFGKLRSREAGKQLLDGIWAIQKPIR